MSQRALAASANVAEDSVASYEAGRRRPTRRILLQLTQALDLTAAETNELLVAAGFTPEPTGRLADLAARRRPWNATWRELAAYPWPCLVTNERQEIVAWNTPATWVAELDFAEALPLPFQRNLLRIAVLPHFRARVRNWDEVVATLIGIYKQSSAEVTAHDQQSPYFFALVEELLRDYSELFPRMLQLWQTVPAHHPRARTTYPVAWQLGDGTQLAFNCVVGPWSNLDGAWTQDWHPADGTTWAWLGAQATAREDGRDAVPDAHHRSRQGRGERGRGMTCCAGRGWGQASRSGTWLSRRPYQPRW